MKLPVLKQDTKLTTRTQNAIAKFEKTFDVFNHSHSQFSWKYFNLNHQSRLRNIRQLSAEVNAKKHALIEAKHKFMKNQLRMDRIKDELSKAHDVFSRRELEVEREILEDQLDMSRRPIEGAMKDILVLEQCLEALCPDDLSEEEFEKDEARYWIRRLVSQSIWDIRATGRISQGNQEALENIGLNPSTVLQACDAYLQKEITEKQPGTQMLDEFLDVCVQSWEAALTEALRRRGVPISPVLDALTHGDDL